MQSIKPAECRHRFVVLRTVLCMMFALHAVIASVTRGQDQGPKSPERLEMEAMLKAWQKKQQAIRTVHLDWSEKLTISKGAWLQPGNEPILSRSKNPHRLTVPPETTTYDVSFSLILDGDKIRHVRDYIICTQLLGIVPQKYEWVSAGNGRKSLWHAREDDDAKYPQARIARKDVFVQYSDVDEPVLKPVLIALRPFHPALNIFNDFLERYEVIPGRTDIEGRSCIQVKELPTDPLKPIVSLWIDPERDYSIVRMEEGREEEGREAELWWRFTFHEFEKNEAGWIPVKWSAMQPAGDGSSRTTHTAFKTASRINEPVDSREFELVFPVGTWVFDAETSSEYLVRKDGTKRPILKSERRISYEDLMASEPGDFSKSPAPHDLSPEPARTADDRRKFLITIGALLIACCLGIALFWSVRRRRAARRGP